MMIRRLSWRMGHSFKEKKSKETKKRNLKTSSSFEWKKSSFFSLFIKVFITSEMTSAWWNILWKRFFFTLDWVFLMAILSSFWCLIIRNYEVQKVIKNALKSKPWVSWLQNLNSGIIKGSDWSSRTQKKILEIGSYKQAGNGLFWMVTVWTSGI